MREILQSKDPADGKRIADKVAQTIIDEALKGNYQMMQILLDRVEGKVMQPVGGPGGKDLVFSVVVSNDGVRDMVNDVLAGKRTDASSSAG